MEPSGEDLRKTLEIAEEQYEHMQASGTAAIEELMVWSSDRKIKLLPCSLLPYPSQPESLITCRL